MPLGQGNKEDIETRRSFAKKKIEQIKSQVEAFKPQYTIPFASFVWFSHEENFYMNDEINKIDKIEALINDQLPTKPIIMFPNDNWILGDEYDNRFSVKKWMTSYKANVDFNKTTKAISVKQQDLIVAGQKFIETLKKDNTFWMSLF